MALPPKFSQILVKGAGYPGSAQQYYDTQFPDTENCIALNQQIAGTQADIDAAYQRKKTHFDEGRTSWGASGSTARDAYINVCKKMKAAKEKRAKLLACDVLSDNTVGGGTAPNPSSPADAVYNGGTLSGGGSGTGTGSGTSTGSGTGTGTSGSSTGSAPGSTAAPQNSLFSTNNLMIGGIALVTIIVGALVFKRMKGSPAAPKA